MNRMLRIYILTYLNFVLLFPSLAYFSTILKKSHINNARKLNHNNHNKLISKLHAKSKKKDNASGSWDWINSKGKEKSTSSGRSTSSKGNSQNDSNN